MTNNTRKAIHACLLLLAILIGACAKDSIMPESKYEQPQDFRLADARKHYEENIANLSFPELYLKPLIQTKGSSYFHSLEQTPLWDRFHFSENGWSYIYEIPILYNITLQASMGYLTQDGQLKKEDKEVKLQSNLIIQKYKESGNVHIFLSTIVGYISNPDAEIHGASPWLWTGDRKTFTGYQFFTNPDGSFREAFQYSNSHRTGIVLDIYNKEYEYIYPQEVFTILFGSIGTKGNEMVDKHKYCDDCQRIVDWDESNCPQCGSWLIDLDEIIVTPQPDPQPERCAECNFLIENCVCDNNNVDECPHCGLPHCSGECMNIGGDGTGSGGSTAPGGNQGDDNHTDETADIVAQRFTLDETSAEVLKLELEELYRDCFGKNIYDLFNYKISLKHDPNLRYMATTSSDGRTIRWNMNFEPDADMITARLVILEELVHSIQYKNNWIYKTNESNNWMNAEVEAKIAIYKYAKKNNCINSLIRGNSEFSWSESIEPYLDSPTQENYERIVNFIRSMGGTYSDETKFQNDLNKRTIENIIPLMCY